MKMNRCVFRTLLLVLVLMLTIVTVSATAYTDPYVVRFAPENAGSTYPYRKPYLYATPFLLTHRIQQGGEILYEGNHFPELYHLVNQCAEASQEGEFYASIGAYSLEPMSAPMENSLYRRINLECCEEFDDVTAGRIRAILLHTFPYEDTAAVEKNANLWLNGQGLEPLADLQSGEAVLATQAALWTLTAGEGYSISDLYAGRMDLTDEEWNEYLSMVQDSSGITQQETEHTASNVQMLYRFLLSLPAEGNIKSLISENSFLEPTYVSVRQPDGTYSVTVSFRVDADISREGDPVDELTLSANCAGQTRQEEVSGAGEYRFTFTGLEKEEGIRLAINGHQTGADIYMFMPEEDDSMAMAGFDCTRQSVHGEILLEKEACTVILPESRQLMNLNMNVDVENPGQNSASFAVGENHTWLIRAAVPKNLEEGCRLIITDVLSHGLSCVPESITVTAQDGQKQLEEDIHYVLTGGSVAGDGEMVDSFSISMLPQGIASLGAGELCIRFQGYINPTAQQGVSLHSSAWMQYTDKDGKQWEVESDRPQVSTGGLNISLMRILGSPVSGKECALYRQASEEELLNDQVRKEHIQYAGSPLSLVSVPFYPHKDFTGKTVTSVTTDDNGRATFAGLSYGTYYLLCQGMEPISVCVNESSHLTAEDGWLNADGIPMDNTLSIQVPPYRLPETGGMGNAFILLSGIILLAAGWLLMQNKNRWS